MRGFIDLHCHWVAGIDDGVRTPDESLALLSALHHVGFSTVVATPHMRPGMFDNTREDLQAAYQRTLAHVSQAPGPLPHLGLGSEHFFDDIVYERIRKGAALPYPGLAGSGEPALTAHAGEGILVELPPGPFPLHLDRRLYDVRRVGLRPVLAHPERYHPVWHDDACLDPLIDAGAFLQLDICALVGKYGAKAEAAAEKLLEEDAYELAASDAHRPKDVEEVSRAIERLEVLVGPKEAYRLLSLGPQRVLKQREASP